MLDGGSCSLLEREAQQEETTQKVRLPADVLCVGLSPLSSLTAGHFSLILSKIYASSKKDGK